MEAGESFVQRVGVGTVFLAAATEWAEAQGGNAHSVFWKQRLVGWNIGLHMEIAGNRVREVRQNVLSSYTSGLPTNAC